MNQDFERTLHPTVDIPEDLTAYLTVLFRVGALGFMSSAIMHEISNALTVVSGNVQIIQLRDADMEKDDLLKRMTLIIDQIARIEGTIARVGSFGARLFGQLKKTDPQNALDNALYAFKRRSIIDGPEIHYIRQTNVCAIKYDPSLMEYALLEMFMLFQKVNNDKDLLDIKSSVSETTWTVEAALTPKSPPNLKAPFWRGEELPKSVAGTLLILDKFGGALTLFRRGNILGWRMDFPLAADHD